MTTTPIEPALHEAAVFMEEILNELLPEPMGPQARMIEAMRYAYLAMKLATEADPTTADGNPFFEIAAGIMLAFTNGSFSASIGEGLLIPSFLGPVLGGTSMMGGAVSAVGTLIGTFLTLTIRQGLTLRGIGLDWLNIALGLVLLLAISAGQIRRRRGRS